MKPLLSTPPLLPVMERWSPRAFAPTEVTREHLATIFEAARWAASSFNEQPWRFIVATNREAGFTQLADCLVEANAWARQAPVLLLSVAKTHFTRNGADNPHAWHDVGAAMCSLSLQAAALGFQVHQMAGFVAERARTACSIPDGFAPVAMAAIGWPGDTDQLPEHLQAIETAPRQRHQLSELVFSESFGHPADCDSFRPES